MCTRSAGWRSGGQAAGGLAIARDVAVGGLAIADHAAFGGAGGTAYARDYALGFQGSAAHFNDDAAKTVLLAHPLKLVMDWTMAHMTRIRFAMFAVAFVPWMAILPLMYRPKRDLTIVNTTHDRERGRDRLARSGSEESAKC